jgi:Zn finger protein HypA/HybF involved in hydrogenase expression
MFNENDWVIKCDNCQKEMVYLKMYMETINGYNELILETFPICPHCGSQNSQSLKNK